MSEIQKSTLLKALNNCISLITPKAIIFAIFIAHVLMDGSLSAEAVFVTMSIFNNLRFNMSFAFTQSIALAAELYVSCRRIQVLYIHQISDYLLRISFLNLISEISALRRSCGEI